MNQNTKYCILLLICSYNTFAAPLLGKTSYWQCTTLDSANKQWSARSIYQKAALNIAFAACKKESKTPSTCRSSSENCEGFNQGMSTRPAWQCTALDQTADTWQSNLYSQRDDAALAAKAYCKQKSVVPDTCYINLVTCRNLHEGGPM